MNVKYLVGRALGWPLARLLRSRWFPVLRTFHLRQNWAYDVCRFAGTREIRMIFDVGANVGDMTRYAGDFFPRATIHAFEPVRATCDILRKRTQGRRHVHVHQLALGQRTEAVRIALQNDSVFNSLGFLPGETGQAENTEVIQVTTVDEFCAAQGIDYIDLLKTDAQGFDIEVLRGADGLIANHAIGFVYSEVGFLDGDRYNTPFARIDQHLRTSGFQLAGFYEQTGLGPRGRTLGFCNALYVHPAALAHRFERAGPPSRP